MKKGYSTIILVIILNGLFFGAGFYFGKKGIQDEIEKMEAQRFEQQLEAENQARDDWESRIESRQEKVCNEKTAEEQFRYWMEFQYPDWEILSSLSIVPTGECSYYIRFTTINPHLAKFGVRDKEVVVVQIQYRNNYEEFLIETVRGSLLTTN